MTLFITKEVFNAGLKKVVLSNSNNPDCKIRRVFGPTFWYNFDGFDYEDYKHFDYGISMDLGNCGNDITLFRNRDNEFEVDPGLKFSFL